MEDFEKMETYRLMEAMELQIVQTSRKLYPKTRRALAVYNRQWGAHGSEVSRLYLTDEGKFFLYDAPQYGDSTDMPVIDALTPEEAFEYLHERGIEASLGALDELIY